MEAVRKLTVDIMSYLKGDGFKKLENEIDKSKMCIRDSRRKAG